MNSFNLKSYFKFLSRNKGYTAINLVGFSISLMFVILLGLYIKQESQFDQFHENKDRIFLLHTERGSNLSAPVAIDLQNRYPEIEKLARMFSSGRTIQINHNNLIVDVLFTDPSFFDMFSFPFAEGVPENQLRTISDAAITESFAAKIFENESVIGKTLVLDTLTLNIGGVVKDFKDTHFGNPDIIVPFEHVGRHYLETYDSAMFSFYLQVHENTIFSNQLPDAVEYLKSYYWYFKDNIAKELFLEPLTESHFKPQTKGNGKWVTTNRSFIWILTLSALAILLFSIINYINLSVAQSGFRAREAATRRLLGESRYGLVLNYITEAILFCAGAFILAILLAFLAEPFFNQLLGSDISVREILSFKHILLILVFIILLGGISGIIPALAISRFKPIEVVKGEFKRKTKMVFSKIFICFQFCITIILLGCTITILRQTHFMRNMDLGFDKEHTIYMDNTLYPSRYEGLRSKLMEIPGVQAVSFTAGSPVNGGNNNTLTYEDGKTISFQTFQSDSLFFSILDLEVIRTTGINSPDAVWINQQAVKELGLTENDHTFEFYDKDKLEIAGIVKDFNIRNLSYSIPPVIIFPRHEELWIWEILVKIDDGNPRITYQRVKDAYSEYNGGEPFNSGFIDETIDNWYNGQERMAKIIGYFALLAILISALGLLAMATYFMRQRAVDVAIRKVFGSSNREILKRLIGSFLKIVLVSFIIAIPVIWYIMSQWLQDYTYRIKISWTIFAAAGGIAFIIAFIAVFWQAYKATNANPIHSLKD